LNVYLGYLVQPYFALYKPILSLYMDLYNFLSNTFLSLCKFKSFCMFLFFLRVLPCTFQSHIKNSISIFTPTKFAKRNVTGKYCIMYMDDESRNGTGMQKRCNIANILSFRVVVAGFFLFYRCTRLLLYCTRIIYICTRIIYVCTRQNRVVQGNQGKNAIRPIEVKSFFFPPLGWLNVLPWLPCTIKIILVQS
jgi:hypothetical protein